jgi:hypothetical protein
MGSKERNPDLWDQFKREFAEIIAGQECSQKLLDLGNQKYKRFEFNLDSLSRPNIKSSEGSGSHVDLVRLVLNHPSEAIAIVEELLQRQASEGLKEDTLKNQVPLSKPGPGFRQDPGHLQWQLRGTSSHSQRTYQQTHQ